VAVFAVGAGAGALIVATSHHNRPARVVIKRTTTTTTTREDPSTTRASSTRPSVEAKPGGASHYGSTVPAAAGSSFATYEDQVAGRVGLAVAPLGAGQVHIFGRAQVAHAWSTSKVPVLVTLLRDDERRRAGLSPEERTDAALALEQSDNAAIDALFARLEQIHGGLVPASEAMQGVLRAAGDDATTVNTAPNDQGFTTEGQTEWSVRSEVTFYRALARGCLLDGHDTAYVLGLMRSVVPSQRWGAGAAGYPSAVPLAFKGGWGPDSTGHYQVRQSAIVGSGGRGYVLSMLALPDSGSFSDGTVMLSSLATWARQHFMLDAKRPAGGCAGTR
jgi:hypothetical protein